MESAIKTALQAEANRVSFDRAVGLEAEQYEMEKKEEQTK